MVKHSIIGFSLLIGACVPPPISAPATGEVGIQVLWPQRAQSFATQASYSEAEQLGVKTLRLTLRDSRTTHNQSVAFNARRASFNNISRGTVVVTLECLDSSGKTLFFGQANGVLGSSNLTLPVAVESLQDIRPTPTPIPTLTPRPTPTVTATPSAANIGLGDNTVIEKTTFNGKVFDDTNAPLDGVSVKAKSLSSSVPFEVETITAGGFYAFNNAPTGIQVEIIASKPGFSTRRRVEVLKSNKQGDPNANRYDFGTDIVNTNSLFSAFYNALSDKPEVTMASPMRNSAGVDPQTNFVFKFSEPMDIQSVTQNIAIRLFTNSLDNFSGAQPFSFQGDNITVSWNSDDTECTISIGNNKLLNNTEYQISFTAQGESGFIKDKSGITRSSHFFKLTDGNFENSYKFRTN